MKVFHRWGAAKGFAALLTVSCFGSDAHARVCSLTLQLDDDVTLGALQLAVSHQSGSFEGDAACVVAMEGAIGAFGVDAEAQRLDASFVSIEGLQGPGALATCTITDPGGDLSEDDFTAVVVEATDTGGNAVDAPNVSVVIPNCETSTSTTLEERICEITFSLSGAGLIAGLDWEIDYQSADGEFPGSGNAVDCSNLRPPGTLASYNDVEATRTIRGAAVHASGFNTPADLVRCRFVAGADDPVAADFVTSVSNAVNSAEVPADPMPQLLVSDIDCSGEQQEVLCGDANQSGTITASDALRILETALGIGQLCPNFRCDTDSSGKVLANDALRALRRAVGQEIEFDCPDQ